MKTARPDFRKAAKLKLAEDRGELPAAVRGLLSVDAPRLAIRSVRLQEIHLRPDRALIPVDVAALEPLASSISEVGILEPILVRPRPAGGYELLAGERRLRAARTLDLALVPVVVSELDDATAARLDTDGSKSTGKAPTLALATIETDRDPDAVGVMATDVPKGSDSIPMRPTEASAVAGRRFIDASYGLPPPARSASPRREPRVISGPGLPATAEPRVPAAAVPDREASQPPVDVERPRRTGFWSLPRLRLFVRRDRA